MMENETQMPDKPLAPEEIRALGCLLEKEIATPEYYPMTLNALTNACNQKSNRDPVMDMDSDVVEGALDDLRGKKMVMMVTTAGSRAAKFRQTLGQLYDLDLAERALLCELMVRGPQTAGELRTRCERLRPFLDVEEVEKFLTAMAEAYPRPLVKKLARQPGRKEPRYAQLLGGAPPEAEEGAETAESEAAAPTRASLQSRVETLEEELTALRGKYEALQNAFDTFKKEFE